MWDAQNMRFTNISSSDVLKIVTSDDFKVIDGHPYFDTKYAEFNALEAANEYIRHTYREGWSLPECRYKYETIYYISTMYGHAPWAGRTAGGAKSGLEGGYTDLDFPQSYVDGDLG